MLYNKNKKMMKNTPPMWNPHKKATEEIVEKPGSNLFSILFWSNRALEEIQTAANEVRDFKTEWQFHYTALVGRVRIDNTLLDIGFPLVAYNYPQEVSYGSVHFHLDDVSDANEQAIERSHSKIEELQNSETFQFINNVFENIEWNLVGFNTVHAHPGSGLTFKKANIPSNAIAISGNERCVYSYSGISEFSSVDLKKNASNPGVVYPLKEGVSIPSFAGILQHGDTRAELIHSEYRLFSKNGDKLNYLYGRNVTIVSGRTPMPVPTVVPTVIHELFGIDPDQLKKDKPRHSYLLLDMKDGKRGTENTLFHTLLSKWDAEYFSVDHHLIDPENIISEVDQGTVVVNTTSQYGQKSIYKPYNNHLFSDEFGFDEPSPFERFTLSVSNSLLTTFSDNELIKFFAVMGNMGTPLLSFSHYDRSAKLSVFVKTFNSEPAAMKRVIIVGMLRLLLEVEDSFEDMSDDEIIQMFNEYYE
jgi:hypothetical protein